MTATALLTDLYQLTMAYGYWRLGRHDHEAVFHLFYRQNPFNGNYCIACGLEPVLQYLKELEFSPGDLDYLGTLQGNDGRLLFCPEFLDYLGILDLKLDVDAIPEGTVVFPHEPLVRVQGPLLQCQLVETALLNGINFPTLIATKASQICRAAHPDPVLEFGLRRAQGPDGAITASRAAYCGGVAATSNVLAGRLFGIPVRGTHAHSWITSFTDELEAFEQYAKVMPNNCVFLVDTYDTLEGTKNAIKVALEMREAGHEIMGIRLDSGDLGKLSITARWLLDTAGFSDAAIVASNDLDEHRIRALKEQGAQITVWGVGTRLVTGHDQPALGGVYKLAATRAPGKPWRPVLKLSDDPVKISTPGILQVRRYGDPFVGDMIYDKRDALVLKPQNLGCNGTIHQDLLVPVMRHGHVVYASPSLTEIRARTLAQLDHFSEFTTPHRYPVNLEPQLYQRKQRLIQKARTT